MSDEMDLAQAAMLREQDGALTRARLGDTPPGREDCSECGETIDAKRLAVHPHAQRCLYCQGQVEERLRR